MCQDKAATILNPDLHISTRTGSITVVMPFHWSRRFGLFSRLENGGPFSLKEVEMGQDITLFITLFKETLPFLCPLCAWTATDAFDALSFLLIKDASNQFPANARTGLFQLRHRKFPWKSLKGG